MDSKFTRDTAVRRLDTNLFEGQVSRDWWIVFGPNGGFVAALLLRAIEQAVDDVERVPRSLTIHYTAAPEEGRVQIHTTVERAGRSLTTVSARMVQDGRLIALAIAAFSRPRKRALEFDDTALPAVRAPEEIDPVVPRADLPPFSRQWEVRPAIGGPPFQERDEAVTGGWIRPLEATPIDGALVAQLADAWIPAVFQRLAAPNPVPTIDLTVHFRSDLPLAADFVLSRFQSRFARGGFVEEDGEIWSRDGTLIAHSRQLALLQAPSQD